MDSVITNTSLGSVFLFLIIKFPSQFRGLLDAITNRVRAIKSMHIRKGEIALTFDTSHSEEEKNKVATELAQKREEDYVYRDWNNAAYIAYNKGRYEVALHDLSQALQYAKTKEQTVQALVNQGVVIGEMGRSEEALQVYKQVDERYGKDIESGH